LPARVLADISARFYDAGLFRRIGCYRADRHY
jgi:hypothetical protein